MNRKHDPRGRLARLPDGQKVIIESCEDDAATLIEHDPVFQPLDGDVIVFDNWRVMHARRSKALVNDLIEECGSFT